MTSSVHHYRQLFQGLLLVCLLTLTQTASAQWWRFGADAGQPVFSDLLFNNVSALRVDRSLQFSPEDLDQRKISVRGRAEVGQGKIGRIEASLDDGVTWTAIPVGERGLFAFEFMPEIERPYRFKIRALSTTGQSSDEAEHAFEFKVVKEDNRALAQAAFKQLLERYMARDRSGFMSLVSREFLGNETALDSAIGNDFRFFDSIRIDPTIQRMAASDNRWTIYFNFRRQVRSVRTGQVLTDQAQTSVTLIRDGDGYKLQELAAPLIFGVSDPSNVATYVTSESVGKDILVVDDKGNTSIGKQGQDVTPSTEGDSTLPVKTGQLNVTGHPPAGFNFTTGTQTPVVGDFVATGGDDVNGLWSSLGTGVTIIDLGSVGIDSISSVPELGYSPSIPGGYLRPGRTYAFRLANGRYALLEITSITQTGPYYLLAELNFKYQPDGSRNF